MVNGLLKISTILVIVIALFSIPSCSDITNIPTEQIKEHAIMLDGPGSNIITANQQLLYVLNDKIVSSTFITRIKPVYIDSISVLRGDAAIQFYGKDGKKGVVEIFADDNVFTDLKPVAINRKRLN